MHKDDSAFSFEQFANFCTARSGERDLTFKVIVAEYFAAYPTHGVDFQGHLKQHPELYQQLITQMNTLRVNTPQPNTESDNGMGWKDRIHIDSNDRGFERS